MADTIFDIRGTSRKSALPAPAPTAFGAGQPKFTSMKSGESLSSMRDAASAISRGSEPNIWIPNGRSASSKAIFSNTRAASDRTARQ